MMNRANQWTLARSLRFGTVLMLAIWVQPAAAQPGKSAPEALKQYSAAVAFQNRQLYDLAVDEWKTFLEKYPKDPLVPKGQHYLGVCYFQLQKYPEAEASFSAVVANSPKFELLADTYLNLGLAQYNRGHAGDAAALDAAIGSLTALVEKFPDGGKTTLGRYYLAEALYSRDRKDEAIAAYRQIVDGKTDAALKAKALYGLGVTLEETGKMEPAGAAYDQFLKEFPDNELKTEIIMRKAETQLTLGKPADAEKGFAAAAGTDGFAQADYATLRQAVCRYEQNDYAGAGDLYAQLLKKYPESSYKLAAQSAAGKCFYLAARYDDAVQWLKERQAGGGPEAIEAAHWQARCLLQTGKPGEALAVIDLALPNGAESSFLPDLKMDRADALYDQSNRRGESVAAYAEMAGKFPDHRSAPQAAYMAAYAALGVNQFDEAVQHADTFLARFSESDLRADVLYVTAESQLQLRDYTKAAQNFKRLLADFPARPERPQWVLRSGLCLQLQKQYEQAVAAISAELATLKEPAQTAEAQYLIGSSQFELKHYPEALAALNASIQADPQWRQADETLLVLARTQHLTGATDAAIATLDRLTAEFPRSALLDRATFRHGEFQYALGKFEAAATDYAALLEKWPQSPLAAHALFGRGWSFLSQQQYGPAEGAFTLLLKDHADHPLAAKASYARAMARQPQGKFAEALADAETFLKSNPTGIQRLDALYVQGLSQSGLQQFDAAAASFEAILKEDPGYAAGDKVLYELAWTRLSGGKEPEAAELFARLAKEYPDSNLVAESHYRVGERLYGEKKYEEAAKSYFAAQQKGGASDLGEKAAYKLAWSYYQLKQYEKATQSFDYLTTTFPQGSFAADGLILTGESLFQLGNFKEAQIPLEKAQAGAASSDTLAALGLLRSGQVAAQLEQWEKSLAQLKLCAEKYPESDYKHEVLYEQAWALQNLGSTDDALKIFTQVAGDNDYEIGARARFMEGEILFLKKSYDDAIRSFFKVAYGYGAPKSPESYHQWQANATFEAARCCEMLKKTTVAKRLYKEVVDLYPQTDKVAEAKKKLETLGP